MRHCYLPAFYHFLTVFPTLLKTGIISLAIFQHFIIFSKCFLPPSKTGISVQQHSWSAHAFIFVQSTFDLWYISNNEIYLYTWEKIYFRYLGIESKKSASFNSLSLPSPSQDAEPKNEWSHETGSRQLADHELCRTHS